MTQNRIAAETPWYDLFSRGARDWLRHNQKVRESVTQSLPEMISQADIITGPQERTVQVPIRMLEHARFRLQDKHNQPRTEAGQGQAKPGDVLRPYQPQQDKGSADQSGEGEIKLMLELQLDDIMDWLWEELKLPDLQPKRHAVVEDHEFVREGWDRHGAHARLDRRRTMKEAVKRRAIQPDAPPFSNEDLRYRQLVQRKKPATKAVVIFALDVSASMTEAERKLAKNFFFFALQGIRRRYEKVETRFIAHTTQAWEFVESEFFQVTGTGGTGASTAFKLALDMINAEYPASNYNSYLFYASDGENFTEDREAATRYLADLSGAVNYIGYVETVPGTPRASETEMKMICSELEKKGAHIGTSILNMPDDVWKAIRKFFVQQSEFAET